MRTSRARFAALAVLLVSGAARAEGNDAALMVAVEIDAGLGVDAGEVRGAIGAELHRPIAAPAAAPGTEMGEILLVSMGRGRTVVSFRSRADETAAREIATPPDRSARLRAVAWLAGNLARDQVSGLLLATGAEPAPVPPAAPPPATDSVPTTTQPPPVTTPAAESASVVVRTARDEAPAAEPTWTISMAAGEAATWYGFGPLAGRGNDDNPFLFDYTGHLDVKRRMPGKWLLGAAFDYGPSPQHGAGYALTAGLGQRWRRLGIEESAGLGLERTLSHTFSEVVFSPTTGSSSETVTTTKAVALYMRAALTLAYPVSHSWDVVAMVGARAGAFDPLQNPLVDGTLGVRIRVP